MKHKKELAAIDRQMNEEIKRAKSANEIMVIKRDAEAKRRALMHGELKPEPVTHNSSRIEYNISVPHFGDLAKELEQAMRHTVTMYHISPGPALDLERLSALKTVEPHKPTRRIPDMVEVITGWRAWRVAFQDGEYRLKALGKADIWEPKKELRANCHKRGEHRAPGFDCECGVWAFKELDILVSALEKYSDIKVLGKVSLWGRVIETENGYRAEKAYPSELWIMGSRELEELGLVYDVPIRSVER